MTKRIFYVVELGTPGEYDPETYEEQEYLHPFDVDTSAGDTHNAYYAARLKYPHLEVIGHHLTTVYSDPDEIPPAQKFTMEQVNEMIAEKYRELGLLPKDPDDE